MKEPENVKLTRYEDVKTLINDIKDYVKNNENADVVLVDDRKRMRAVFFDMNIDNDTGWFITTPTMKRCIRHMPDEKDRKHYNDVLFHGKEKLIRFLNLYEEADKRFLETIELLKNTETK